MSGVDIAVVVAMLEPFGIEQRTAAAIATMIVIHATRSPEATVLAQPPRIASVARAFHRSSLRRQEFVGRAADDPGWNMLLAMFADQTDDVAVSVSSACHASGGAPTTALRHLTLLQQNGIVRRTPDPADARRAFVDLTPAAYSQMEKLIISFCVEPPSS